MTVTTKYFNLLYLYVNYYNLIFSRTLSFKVTNTKLDGISPAAAISTSVHGGLFYTPLTGDMVTTVHEKPQVRLYVNDVPTACSGDCSFQWKSSVTPTVTEVSPSTGRVL